MNKKKSIIIFKNKKIRRHWDEDKELWYFSVIDVIYALTESERPRKYWNDLKKKLASEGSQLSEKIGQLKLLANDGKKYFTDVLDTENLFRLIQSIPSPKAEPFKLWLAKVGYERVEETEDPELGIDRAMETYLRKGYDEKWINQRLKSIEVRKELTDEWKKRGVERDDYAILTNEITRAWSDMSVKQYKKLKSLRKENLRDNMSNLELVLNMLAETTTTEISKTKKPGSLKENKKVANEGGSVAGRARKDIEKRTGKKISTGKNNLNLKKKKYLKR